MIANRFGACLGTPAITMLRFRWRELPSKNSLHAKFINATKQHANCTSMRRTSMSAFFSMASAMGCVQKITNETSLNVHSALNEHHKLLNWWIHDRSMGELGQFPSCADLIIPPKIPPRSYTYDCNHAIYTSTRAKAAHRTNLACVLMECVAT